MHPHATKDMNWLKSHAPLRFFFILAVIAIGVWLLWLFRNQRIHTERRDIVSFAAVKPVLEALPDEVPLELKQPNQAKWKAWAQREDDTVRARLEQGGLDSMVNVLLFGTSFTTQPRATTIADSNDPVLQSRLDDLLQGLRNPGKNERLIFLRNLLRSKRMESDTPAGYEKTKAFVLQNFRRVVQEQITFRERFAEATRESDQTTDLSKRSRVFRDRGISLDTTILSSFGIESALRDMKNRAMLKADLITQVAVIGPGLDFTDKGFGYDFILSRHCNRSLFTIRSFDWDWRNLQTCTSPRSTLVGKFSSIYDARATAPKLERTMSCNCRTSPGRGLLTQSSTGVRSVAKLESRRARFSLRRY